MAKLRVTKIKSTIGQTKNTIRVIEGMGLRKLGSERVLPDNNCIRGMINKVKHLVSYEMLNDSE